MNTGTGGSQKKAYMIQVKLTAIAQFVHTMVYENLYFTTSMVARKINENIQK